MNEFKVTFNVVLSDSSANSTLFVPLSKTVMLPFVPVEGMRIDDGKIIQAIWSTVENSWWVVLSSEPISDHGTLGGVASSLIKRGYALPEEYGDSKPMLTKILAAHKRQMDSQR